MSVNRTYQWTHLFIAAHGHYGIAKIFSYFFLVLIYFLDIFSIQEYLDLEYRSFSMKHDRYISCMLIICLESFTNMQGYL
jgi:hypothetical protein